VNRWGVFAVGAALLIAADIVLAVGNSILIAGVGVALWGLHMGFTQGLLAALVADTATATQRGTAFGVFNFVMGLALLAASVLAGALWDRSGPTLTFLTGAALAGGAAAVAFVLHLRGKIDGSSHVTA
jgi:predicted MFS family arabinose efflux permease